MSADEPVETLMRSTAVPTIGTMSKADVVVIATMASTFPVETIMRSTATPAFGMMSSADVVAIGLMP